MNRIENHGMHYGMYYGMHTTTGYDYRDTQKFFDTLQPMGEKCLRRILTHLDCTKYNEINISHSHTQKHISLKNDIKN